MILENQNDRWKARSIRHFWPWDRGPIRPAEVIDAICELALDRKNILEDANYAKNAPNQFIVEIGLENYRSQYQPIEGTILQQWEGRLKEHLMLANDRLGRVEYRLAGPVKIQIRAAEALRDDEARVLFRLDAGAPSMQHNVTACVELTADGRRWQLKSGVNTIGRDPGCDIYIDLPAVLSKRLVSSRHAFIVCDGARSRLFDGDPAGGASLNGTYANNRFVTPEGHELQDGDLIILAALVLGRPRPDTPGTAVLRFRGSCS